MIVGIKAWATFVVVWFGQKALDHFSGSENLPFNAALAVLAAIIVIAMHFDQKLSS